MGFIEPTPVQAELIPMAMKGSDVIATAPTGTGKTVAFAVPLMNAIFYKPGKLGLVLSPTRELSSQIFKVISELGEFAKMWGSLVIGGESFGRQARDLRDEIDFIIATPGRLNDHLQEGTVDLSQVSFLVLDEVDRMLDMGFAPQIKQIVRHVPKERQTLLLSATFPLEIQRLAATLLNNPLRVNIEGTDRPIERISETTIQTSREGKVGIILKEVETRQGRILIFTRTKIGADRLAAVLQAKGHPVVKLHGGRNPTDRKRALAKFQDGSHRIMVATDLAGRGIDVADIEHVINYDVPSTREDYIHRLGRTARYGKTGSALNLIVPGDADGERVVSGIKAKSRVVFRSRRRPTRSTR